MNPGPLGVEIDGQGNETDICKTEGIRPSTGFAILTLLGSHFEAIASYLEGE